MSQAVLEAMRYICKQDGFCLQHLCPCGAHVLLGETNTMPMTLDLILVYIYLNTMGKMLEIIKKDFLYQKILAMKKIFSLTHQRKSIF